MTGSTNICVSDSDIREDGRQVTIEPLHLLTLKCSPQTPESLILIPLRSEEYCGRLSGYQINRQTAVEFAKAVLREFAPTTDDEILASLKRIEGRLREKESGSEEGQG